MALVAEMGSSLSTRAFGLAIAGLVFGAAAVLATAAVGLGVWAAAPVATATDCIGGLIREPGSASFSGDMGRAAGHLPQDVRMLLAAVEAVHVKHSERTEDLIATVSAILHDQKAPVAGAAIALDAISPGSAFRGDVRQMIVESMEEVSRSLSRAIDVLRLGLPDVEVHRETVDVRKAVDVVVARVAPIADQRRVAVTVHGGATGEYDPALVFRAVEAAVLNAVTAARSLVDIELLPGMIRVSDDGPGLSSWQFGSSRTYRRHLPDVDGAIESTGLGMTIIHYALTALGGRVRFEKSSPTGTVVLLYLGA